ncbi:MAG: thioredoxin domain-containing protein [Planctomycetes bacterium]|nr:thioredoxin domain-containing protein [Planctomycetota bacterium]
MSFTNRLSHETSPYLRQHSHNPVDWFPWGEEALRKAKELDRPIFLSIGYSACHWCHVMERESFEDPEVGKILNENFISIKVDREERPDLDQIYMTAVQLLTQHPGWPMSVFLTPDLKPFYGGTYFPPKDHYNLPSFKRLLTHLIKVWREQRSVIEDHAGELTGHIQSAMALKAGADAVGPEVLRQAAANLRRAFDPQHGGFGGAPKFPHPMDLRLLLRIWHRFDDEDALSMVRTTLDHMAMGGIYDHLGGGFHRYSTDERWLVPHFEKMLYDNALLCQTYLEAYQATGEMLYCEVVQETLAYVQREMTSPEGPFFSTQDADSEGVEGKFFVWSHAEIERVLGKEEAELFAAIFDVTDSGNWEGHNILNRSRPYEQEAKLLKMPVEELRRRLEASKRKLFDEREKRVKPGRDEKILTAWNGLMIAAFAQAAQVLDNPDYLQAATRAADFVLSRMRTPDGRLLRTAGIGAGAKLNAYLEDYSYLIDALVSLYEADFEPRWIEAAREVARVMIEQFWDEKEGGFYYTGKEHERLIARGKDPHDHATPSGNSMAVTGLLRLQKLTGDAKLLEKVERTLLLFSGLLTSSPMAAGQMLNALDFHLGPVDEIAIVGDSSANDILEVLRLVRQPFWPNKVVALARPGAEKVVPLLHSKEALGAVTTYVCRDCSCQSPVIGIEAARAIWSLPAGKRARRG